MTIGKRIALGFGLALAILVLIGFFAFRSTLGLVESNRWVVHTHQVLETLENLLSLLKDHETGERGYLLTSQRSFLEPYRTALKNIEPTMKKLDELIADNPKQKRALKE